MLVLTPYVAKYKWILKQKERIDNRSLWYKWKETFSCIELSYIILPE